MILCSALFCGIFAIILYSNTLSAEFAYDDNRAVLHNPDLLPETSVADLFYNDFWGTPLTNSGSHKSYRPFCVLTFRINYAIHGLKPLGYHLVNVLCHGLVTALYVYVIFEMLGQVLLATVAGILFACHPIHTEAVAGIVGRADVLSCLFFLCTLLCFISYCRLSSREADCQSRTRTTGNQSWVRETEVCSEINNMQLGTGFQTEHHSASSSRVAHPRRTVKEDDRQSSKVVNMMKSVALLTGVAFCSTASMLSKEQGLTVLIICLIFDLFLQKQFQPTSLLSFHQMKNVQSFGGSIFVLLLSVLLVAFRLLLIGGRAPEFAPADNPASESESLLVRTLTFLYLPCVNMRLLLCPTVLSFDWSMDAIPLLETLSDSRNLLSLLFYTALLTLIVYVALFLNRRDRAADRLQCLCLGLALIVVPFVPATNLFFYVGFVVAERVLYIPSMGFCLLVAAGFSHLLRRCRRMSDRWQHCCWILWLLFAIIVVSFSARTIFRNRDWQTEESLYRSGLKINPAKAWGNLGNILKAQGRSEDAEAAYRTALKYRPNMADVLYNLGLYYQEKKRHSDAIRSYVAAIKCRPKLTLAYLNLGLVYNAIGLKAEAEKMFRRCYSVDATGLRDPRLHEHTKTSALYNLARLMADGDRTTEAVETYKEALRLAPPDYRLHSIHNMLGEAYFQMEDYALAEAEYRLALQLSPDHIPAYLTLAKLFQAKKEMSTAEEWFQKAFKVNPKDVNIFRHYGQHLSIVGRSAEAAEMLLTAVDMDANDFETVFNAANALRQAGKYEQSEEFYRKAVELNPTEVTAQMNLGAILHFNGKLNEAEQVYLAALKMKPDDSIIRTNLKKLHNLMTHKESAESRSHRARE